MGKFLKLLVGLGFGYGRIFEAAFYKGKEDGGYCEPAEGVLEAGEEVVDAVDENCRKEACDCCSFVADAVDEKTAQAGTCHVDYV